MEEYSVTEPSGLPHEQRVPSKEDTLSFEGQPEQISVPRVINERRLKKGIRKIFEALIQEDVELPTTVVVPEVKPKKPKIIRSTPKELLERKPITITPVIIKSQKVEEETRSLDFTICELCHKRIDDIKVTSHCPLKHRHDFHTNCWNTILIDNIVLCLTNINDNPHYCSHYNNISLTIPEVIHEEKEEFPELSVVVPKEKKNEVKKPTVWQPSWRTTTGDVSTYEGEHKPKKKKGRKPDKKVYVDITDYKQPKISEEADKAWNEILE